MDASDNLRYRIIVCLVMLCFTGIVSRLIVLTVWQHDFLAEQSKHTSLRTRILPAHRGHIVDRNGAPLAVSLATDSLALHPHKTHWTTKQIKSVASLIKRSEGFIRRQLARRSNFVYLKRHISPSVRQALEAKKMPGLIFLSEPYRYYPVGEVLSPVIGFTGVGDRGLEGLELAYDTHLAGQEGLDVVEQDPTGHVLSIKQHVKPSHAGHVLQLSIDKKLQGVVYHALSDMVDKVHAKHGSVVVLSPTGEVLAMASYPSFNPNHRVGAQTSNYRNHAMHDAYEPGSVFKPFSLYSVLAHHRATMQTKVSVGKGLLRLNGHTIRDAHRNLGRISVKDVMRYSSNVGMARLTLADPPQWLQDSARLFRLGQRSALNFPGERTGRIKGYLKRGSLSHASFSFGYGLTVTNLQVAQAYMILANRGDYYPLTLLKRIHPIQPQHVGDAQVMDHISQALESVVSEGTGKRAALPGYRIAGKTGTAHLVGRSGYVQRHLASFSGYVPASNPKMIISVFITAPDHRYHFGGQVAAPVFADIVKHGERFLPKRVEGRA